MLTPRSIDTWPSSGDSSRMMSRKIVDFPAPFGPTSPTFSPRWMAATASMNRTLGPCCLLIESKRINRGTPAVAIARSYAIVAPPVSADPDILAEVPLFELLDEQERATLAARVKGAAHPAGTLLVNYGDPGRSLYIVRAGEVEIFARNDTGERIVLETAGPGD